MGSNDICLSFEIMTLGPFFGIGCSLGRMGELETNNLMCLYSQYDVGIEPSGWVVISNYFLK